MKIAIDARILRTSTGRYVERLLHYLQEIDHENQYVILLDKKDFDGWTATNPNFSKVSLDVPNYSVKEQIGYLKLLRTLDVDLVHFAMPQQPIFYFGPSVTTIHDLTLLNFKNYDDSSKLAYNLKQIIFGILVRHVARKSRAVITPTNYVKQDLAEHLHVNPDKIVVTYESAELVTQGTSEPVEQLAGRQFIMYVGRMDPYKNIRRLIEAHQQLLKTHPDLHLALPGKKDGNVQVIEQWTKDNGYKNVHFLGFITDAQLRWLYENTSAYTLASLSEGFGLGGLEAMSYNSPLVSSNATCLPEVYKDGAYYFDPTSVDDMATKINDVLTDDTLRAELIQNGKKVIAGYSWKKMAEETLAAYEKALRKI